MVQKAKDIIVSILIGLILTAVVAAVIGFYTNKIYSLGKEKGRSELIIELQEAEAANRKQNQENLDKAKKKQSKRQITIDKHIELTDEAYNESSKNLGDVLLSDDFIRMWNQDNRCLLQEGNSGCAVDD